MFLPVIKLPLIAGGTDRLGGLVGREPQERGSLPADRCSMRKESNSGNCPSIGVRGYNLIGLGGERWPGGAGDSLGSSLGAGGGQQEQGKPTGTALTGQGSHRFDDCCRRYMAAHSLPDLEAWIPTHAHGKAINNRENIDSGAGCQPGAAALLGCKTALD